MTTQRNYQAFGRSIRRLSHLVPRSTGTLAIFAAALVLAGCSPSSPTGPAPVPRGAVATFILSGTVSETASHGGVPVAGVVVVEVTSLASGTTDEAGFYSLVVPVTSTGVRISKTGYLTTTRPVSVAGDTRLDFEMARNGPYTLAGTVFETTADGRVPVEGVSVYCDSCGSPEGHTFADTDDEGFYSFGWAQSGEVALIVRKTGFALRSPVRNSPLDGWIVAIVNGDTRFDIELVRR